MFKKSRKYFFCYVLSGIGVLTLLILCAGCVNPFAPELTNNLDASDLVVTEQRNPEEVLQNFKVAYAFRDSLLYSDVLDSSFLFVYYDPNIGASGQFVSWGRDVDLETTGKLFRFFQVVDLHWNSTLYEMLEGDKGEISKGFNLTLVGEDTDYNISGRALFSFRRCADERWRITRWKDESDI